MTSRTTLTFRQSADHFSPDTLAAMIADLASGIAGSDHPEGKHNSRDMIADLSNALILNVGSDAAFAKMFAAFRRLPNADDIINTVFG